MYHNADLEGIAALCNGYAGANLVGDFARSEVGASITRGACASKEVSKFSWDDIRVLKSLRLVLFLHPLVYMC